MNHWTCRTLLQLLSHCIEVQLGLCPLAPWEEKELRKDASCRIACEHDQATWSRKRLRSQKLFTKATSFELLLFVVFLVSCSDKLLSEFSLDSFWRGNRATVSWSNCSWQHCSETFVLAITFAWWFAQNLRWLLNKWTRMRSMDFRYLNA